MKNKTLGILLQLGSILVFLVPSAYIAYQSYTFLQNAETATVLVLDERMYSSTPGAGSRVGSSQEFVPIVTYSIQQDSFTVEKMWALWEELNLGDTVTVNYEPAAPTNARVNTFGESYGLPSLLFVLFGILLKVGRIIMRE